MIKIEINNYCTCILVQTCTFNFEWNLYGWWKVNKLMGINFMVEVNELHGKYAKKNCYMYQDTYRNAVITYRNAVITNRNASQCNAKHHNA